MAYNTQYGNLYADSIYSEHPIALWPLDEDVYYLSLIDDTHRLFSNWTLTNCTATDDAYPTLPDTPSPFDSDIYSTLTADTTNTVTITAVSDGAFNPSEISTDIGTFCVNFWLYHKPTYINWFKVGYEYTHTTLGTQTVLSDEILPASTASWLNFNNIYTIPTDWAGYLKLVIQVNFADTTAESDDARSVILNGLSVGQESQTTCFVSLGNSKSLIPEDIGLGTVYGIPADQYGVVSNTGYYLVRNNRLLCQNDGLPIIYGTGHSTKIYPSGTTLPSLIFPGKGMLNEAGRNKQYTLEMWIKLDVATTTAKKIIGPIDSNDGIWVKEGFLTLVIGDEIGSHCVSEWYRPMLMHLILKENNATVLINGEQVIDIPINRKTMDLPNDQDWWGIYSYSSMKMFSIDSISIYPYIISNLVAKRRFVYGQGTPSIKTIDDGFSGTPYVVDFSTAEYSRNIIYPDIERWDAGYFNNLNATKNYISVPNYKLPTIRLEGIDVYSPDSTAQQYPDKLSKWYSNNYIANTLEYPSDNHPKFITLRPNIEYDISGNPQSWNYDGIEYVGPSYLNFGSINMLNETPAAIYGIFEVEEDLPESRTLMSFQNISTGNSFDINIEGDQVKYLINGSEIYSDTITLGIECLVGLNFELAGVAFGFEVAQFFSSPSSVQLYVGGDGTNTFEGKIYLIGFCNQSNYQKIQDTYQDNEVFLDNGLTNSPNYELLIDHLASYTLIPEYEYNKLYLDISVASEWEEYFPLIKFASYVKDSNGDPYFDLDMLQINLGYASVSTTDVWEYNELQADFSTETYQDLKDSVYDSYFSLKKKNTTGNTVSLANSSLQAYLTFQPIDSDQNNPLSTFLVTKDLPENSVIDPDSDIAIDPYATKFIFKDDTIVYPPKSRNFEDYAMVVNFVINQRSILKNPLKIKSLEIASKNLNYASNSNDESQRNFIGTKFGEKIYPQIDLFGELDYKNKNPYLIYKTNTPYLYTTRKSGLKVINKDSIINPTTVKSYEASIPVNPSGAYDYNVGGLSFFMLGDLPDIVDEIPFMEIDHKGGTIAFILSKDETGTVIKPYDKSTTTFLDGGDAETLIFTDIFDGELSDSNASMFINVTIGSLAESPVENVFTTTFPQNGSTIDIINDTITFAAPHGYQTGTQVMYTSTNPIMYLTHEGTYFVRVISDTEISLHPTEADALANTNKINLNGSPSGTGNFTEYPYKELMGYSFYQNGRYVRSPSIRNDEWNYIGVSFPNGLDFSDYSEGQIKLFGGFTFNNLSYYLSDGLGIKSDVTVRVWSDILNETTISDAVGDGTFVTYTTTTEHGLSAGQAVQITGITPSSLDTANTVVESVIDEFSFTVANTSVDPYVSDGTASYIWQEWADIPWADAYVLGQTSSYVINPGDIYAAYTGTNRDVVDDDSGISLSQVETVAITDTAWTLYSGKPA